MTRPQLAGLPAFGLLLAGVFVSALGSEMTRFGLSVWVYQETGSALAFSTLIFFAMVPNGIALIFAGPYVDRWNRRRTMIWMDVVAGLSTLGVMASFYGGGLQQWHLYIALAVNGVASAFFGPAFQASVPMLVPQAQLGRAAGIMQALFALIPIISPALAGFLVAGPGLGLIFIIDLATFGLGILSLLLIKVPQPPETGDDKSALADLINGWRYVWQRRPFVYLIGLVALFFFSDGLLASLFGPLVLSLADARALGLVYAGFGIGALLSGGLLGIWGGPRRRMNGILAGLVIYGFGVIIAGSQTQLSLIIAAVVLIGGSLTLINSQQAIIYQTKAAPEFLGRVFALITLVRVIVQSTSIPIAGLLANNVFEPLLDEGGALAGSVGQLIGVGPGRGVGLIYVGVGLFVLALALGATVTPRFRRLEDDLLDFNLDRGGGYG